MLELIWTRRAEEHLQRVFSELDSVAPNIAESWLMDVGKRVELLSRFPEMAGMWKPPFRKLKLGRELGLFYTIEGKRIILSGIFPLRMDPATILRKLEQTDWP